MKVKNKTINKFNEPFYLLLKNGLLVLLLSLPLFSSAYNIKVEIENCPEYYIYLGMHKGPDFEVVDSVPANKGLVEFKGEGKLPIGVYFIVIPPQSRFDFILAENQDITIKTDTRSILGSLSITGEKQYTLFIELQKEIAAINKARSQLNMELEFYNAVMPDTVQFLKARIDSLNYSQTLLYSKYKTELDEKDYFYKVLNIMEPFNPPDSVKQLQFTNASEHYRYYIEHYLDRIDFTDESLINTPEFVFHQQIKDYCFYFFDIRANKVSDVFKDIDDLVAKTEDNIAFRKYILNYLISRYEAPQDLRLEAILVYVYRNYYLIEKPSWVSDQAYDIMKLRIEDIQFNVVGNMGRDLTLNDIHENQHSIYNIDAAYKVLIFWDPDCDLCTDAILKLKEEYINLEAENMQVVAVYTGTDKEIWKNYISENELTWVNLYDPKHSSNFEQFYGTFKTPRIFVLDDANKILTKDIKPGYIYNFIKSYNKRLTEEKDRFRHMFGG